MTLLSESDFAPLASTIRYDDVSGVEMTQSGSHTIGGL